MEKSLKRFADAAETSHREDSRIEASPSSGSQTSTSSSLENHHGQQIYTVDDALEKLGFGLFQVVITALCAGILLADAMEMMLLSTLCFLVRCQWGLSSTEEAIITSMVFCGSLFGSTLWGLLGDRFGRKKAIVGMECIMLIFGVLSALKLTPGDDRIPGYPWILFCRFGVGLGTSCLPQLSTYYIEFLPRRVRAIGSVLMYIWWSLGAVAGTGLAAIILGKTDLGWHWYVGLTASPMLLGIISIPFFPESARFYVVKGKGEQARKVLQIVAWMNCRTLPEGVVVSHEQKYDGGTKREDQEEIVRRVMSINQDSALEDEKRPLLINTKLTAVPPKHSLKFISKLSLFFLNGKWKVTFLLILIWIASAIFYFGNVLLTSTMFEFNPHCGVNSTASYNTSMTNYTHTSCHDEDLDMQDYLNLMWTAAAEIPGLLVTIAIIEVLGRKLTMAFNFAMIAVGFGLLFLCPSEEMLTFILFFTRAFCMGAIQTMYVYTSEVYPTAIRGMASGILNSFSRMGAISTPYLAQVLFQASDYATIGLYAGLGLVIAVLSLLLPLETKGRLLKDES